MGEVVTVETSASQTPAKVVRSFFDATPEEQVVQATKIANVLSSVIEQQGLFSLISGKKYIKAEGWQTLGTFLGVVPREKHVNRLADGSYEAYVDIVKFRDGTVVGGGSAICSRKEKRWLNADEYAIRSMAITRATGKAFRVGFSWIVTLAGYQPTPEEEIPQEKPSKKEPQVVVYDANDEEQVKALTELLTKREIPSAHWDEISTRLNGRPKKDITGILKEYSSEQEQVATN